MEKLLLPLLLIGFANAGESWFYKEDIAAGEALFNKNCTVCHGKGGAGTVKDWRQKLPNGKLPPPPLNGSAHTWHHSPQLLDKIIRLGAKTYGSAYAGWMPSFEEKLSKKDRGNILKYIHSLWPERIRNDYDAFYKIK